MLNLTVILIDPYLRKITKVRIDDDAHNILHTKLGSVGSASFRLESEGYAKHDLLVDEASDSGAGYKFPCTESYRGMGLIYANYKGKRKYTDAEYAVSQIESEITWTRD